MKIKNVNKVTDYKYLNLFSIQYDDRLNDEKEYIFASRSDLTNPLEKLDSQPDAVVIVPFHTEAKKLVMIEEFRVALGGYQYGFPAGLIDKGETIEQAGKRELFEETGLLATRILKQSPRVFSSSGMTDESVSLLFVECNGKPTNQFNESSEDIQVKLISQQKAGNILFDDTKKFDVKSWIVLNMFAISGGI
ncbi:MAG: NUDIX hydrolase [Desulfobacula sp.]|nr:NUDIX hydrolase [Desulfobacula sp.]